MTTEAMNRIPFCTPDISDYADIPSQVLKEGCIGPGRWVDAFEEAIAQHLDIPAARVVVTTSGSVALCLALLPLRSFLRATRSELKTPVVLCPAYGYHATINAIISMGFEPKLVDVDDQGCMRADLLEKEYNHCVVGVVHVNFSGNMSEQLWAVRDFCLRYDLLLIEDSACSLGHSVPAAVGGASVKGGTYGDVGILSFSVPKLVTTGQGGAVICRHAEHAAMIRTYITQGREPSGKIYTIASNLRMTDMQAALGVFQMQHFDSILKRRTDAINHWLQRGVPLVHYESGPALYNLILDRRPDIVGRLQNVGVQCNRQFKVLVDHPAYSQYGRREDYPGACAFAEYALYLPFGVGMSRNDIDYVADLWLGDTP